MDTHRGIEIPRPRLHERDDRAEPKSPLCLIADELDEIGTDTDVGGERRARERMVGFGRIRVIHVCRLQRRGASGESGTQLEDSRRHNVHFGASRSGTTEAR